PPRRDAAAERPVRARHDVRRRRHGRRPDRRELPVMKILVPVKRVRAPETRIRVGNTAEGPNPPLTPRLSALIPSEGTTFTINPFDEIALEEALRLRERADVEEIVAVTVGGEECVEQLRTAL